MASLQGDSEHVVSSGFTEALTVFYQSLCQRAGAASVQVVSDYQPIGQVDVTIPSPTQNTGV